MVTARVVFLNSFVLWEHLLIKLNNSSPILKNIPTLCHKMLNLRGALVVPGEVVGGH